MFVDCKRWKRAINIAHVESYVGLLADVGADMGMLVSAAGASESAISRARAERGVRVKALSLDELRSWRPVGTVSRVIEIPLVSLEKATKALREAGLRVGVTDTDTEHARIEVFRHHGMKQPSGDVQHAQHDLTDATLNRLSISRREISRGVTAGGGTPNHRWIEVRVMGQGLPIKVLAATEDELAANLSMIAPQFGVPVEALTVTRPEGWPFASLFPF
jgi:hypothetical protein